jgi:hypothetical protein
MSRTQPGKKTAKEKLRWPGIEPGSHAWKARILTFGLPSRMIQTHTHPPKSLHHHQIKIPMQAAVNRSYAESAREWREDPFVAQNRNHGIAYHRFRPSGMIPEKSLCRLQLQVSRTHPLTLCANSLLVLFSPSASPQQLVRRGVPHELTQLAACSTFSWQLFAKQLLDSHRVFGKLGRSGTYYFPRIKVTRDFQRPDFPPLLFPIECSLMVMSNSLDSQSPQQLWEKLSTPLQLITQENPSIRKVVFGPLGFGVDDHQLATTLTKIDARYARAFDSIHFCVERIATELICQIRLTETKSSKGDKEEEEEEEPEQGDEPTSL